MTWSRIIGLQAFRGGTDYSEVLCRGRTISFLLPFSSSTRLVYCSPPYFTSLSLYISSPQAMMLYKVLSGRDAEEHWLLPKQSDKLSEAFRLRAFPRHRWYGREFKCMRHTRSNLINHFCYFLGARVRLVSPSADDAVIHIQISRQPQSVPNLCRPLRLDSVNRTCRIIWHVHINVCVQAHACNTLSISLSLSLPFQGRESWHLSWLVTGMHHSSLKPCMNGLAIWDFRGPKLGFEERRRKEGREIIGGQIRHQWYVTSASWQDLSPNNLSTVTRRDQIEVES